MKFKTLDKLMFREETETEIEDPAADGSGLPEYEYVISNSAKIAGEDGFLEQLEKALKKFDIRMYDIPSTLDTDTYGYLFSKDQLSDAQIEKIDSTLAGNEEVEITGSGNAELEPDTDSSREISDEDEDFKII